MRNPTKRIISEKKVNSTKNVSEDSEQIFQRMDRGKTGGELKVKIRDVKYVKLYLFYRHLFFRFHLW